MLARKSDRFEYTVKKGSTASDLYVQIIQEDTTKALFRLDLFYIGRSDKVVPGIWTFFYLFIYKTTCRDNAR